MRFVGWMASLVLPPTFLRRSPIISFLASPFSFLNMYATLFTHKFHDSRPPFLLSPLSDSLFLCFSVSLPLSPRTRPSSLHFVLLNFMCEFLCFHVCTTGKNMSGYMSEYVRVDVLVSCSQTGVHLHAACITSKALFVFV
jgi:hypothetical protein